MLVKPRFLVNVLKYRQFVKVQAKMNYSSKDMFSSLAEVYSQGRPSPSDELIKYIASFVNNKDLALDVATGNGQCALKLCTQFQKVIATDLSSQQLEQIKKPLPTNLNLFVEEAESLNFDNVQRNSVDLLTIAVGLHWFDNQRFFKRVEEICKPESVVAAWCYWPPKISSEIDKLRSKFEDEYLKPYDEPNMQHLFTQYSNLNFPLTKLDPSNNDEDGVNRKFTIQVKYNFDSYCKHLQTRSSVPKFFRDKGVCPVELIKPELEAAWGGNKEEFKSCTLQVNLLLGKVTK